MPVKGRKPKDNPRHRNPATHEWIEVREVPFEGAPTLPARRRAGKGWPVATRRWWAAVSSMPHCVLWSTSDWSFALDTALVAAEFHSGERTTAATELRQREKVLGTTADARRDLRIRYVPVALEEPAPAEVEEGAPVTSLDDYRELYN